MKYFRDILQTITYDSSEVINIFKKLNIDSVLNDEYLIDYVIQDGMTPEKISHELYDDVDLWWTIMIINNKFDRFYDFPLPDSVLTEYIDYLIIRLIFLEKPIKVARKIVRILYKGVPQVGIVDCI